MPSSEVMDKWKHGKLHSGSKTGPEVKSQKQAVAIMLSERRAEQKHGGHYPEKALGGPMMGIANQAMGPMGAPMGIAPGQGQLPVGPTMAGPGPMPTNYRQLAVGGVAMPGVGGFNMAKEAHMTPMGVQRSEQRNVMHGPVMSSVPGRTDAHKTAVPSGSYVVPADIVSGRGQGNTMAGMQSLQRMFKMGPYGSPAGQIRPGHSVPGAMRAPKSIMASSVGGSHGHHVGKPVPVNIAGGELVVPPENVLETVRRITGDPRHTLETAHGVLDKWVINERKKHIKTLDKLPGPVRD